MRFLTTHSPIRFGFALALSLGLATGTGLAWARETADETPATPHRHHHAVEAHAPSKAEPREAARPVGSPPRATVPVPVPPAPTPPPPEPEVKVPLFLALKFDEINLRKGPGDRYPIEWVYKRRDLPVEVIRAYDVWRQVRDPDGAEGWIRVVQLSDRRTFMVVKGDAALRADASDHAQVVATLREGVIGRITACDKGSAWCRVRVRDYKGYLRRDQLWGLLPDEEIAGS